VRHQICADVQDDDLMVKRTSAVDYYEGETGGGGG